MIEHALTCATALASIWLVRGIVLASLERYAAKPVMTRMGVQERALEAFAIETKAALAAQEHRLDALKAPQNHQAVAKVTGGLGRLAR
jgi:hypothetical protein